MGMDATERTARILALTDELKDAEQQYRRIARVSDPRVRMQLRLMLAARLTEIRDALHRAADRGCPDCGGPNTDGNGSPLYDDKGLCADCGEARHEREQTE